MENDTNVVFTIEIIDHGRLETFIKNKSLQCKNCVPEFVFEDNPLLPHFIPRILLSYLYQYSIKLFLFLHFFLSYLTVH